MRALLFLNEKSRRGRRDGALVCRTLEQIGIDCVRDSGVRDVDAIIVAGGDGSIIRAIPDAIERGLPLGIVPLGTFNDLARTLGIPLTVDEACKALASGYTRPIDVGRVNGSYFVNEASIGLSARIARRQTSEVKQRYGLLGVIGTTFAGIRHSSPFSVTLDYDGRREQFKTIQLTIANSGRFGGIIDRPDASLDDAWLDLYSVEPDNILAALRIAAKIVARDPRSAPGLRTRRAQRFYVSTHRPHRISADGELAGTTPAAFEIVPKAVRVIVPNAAGCGTEISATADCGSPLSGSGHG